MIIVFGNTDLRIIANNISGVKYHFVVRFSICNICNKVEDRQILLNILNYISLESLFLRLIGIMSIFPK